MRPGPALRASDAEVAAEDAGSPWGEDHHRWRWCDPTRVDGGSRTEQTPAAVIEELLDQCAEASSDAPPEAPLAHPRLIRRTR
jgi:hypothetical protein